MEKLLFGTAYYPEYMPYDRVKEDIRMMKDAGMNVVRIAESTWSTLEPKEGMFDFSYIDRVLREIEKQNMKAIIGTPTYAVPSWLVKKDSNVLVTTKEGQARYGHRQLINLLSPTFRFYAKQIIEKLMIHTVSNPSVIGFQIDNETKHYKNIGKEIQELFFKYLKDTFKTTERLNQAFGLAYWSNSIAEWEDMPDMNGCVNGGLASEFEKFQRKIVTEYLAWQAEIVGQYKRDDQFITHNMDFEWKKFGAEIAQDGYSYGVQPEADHSEIAKCITITGTDIYHPTQDALTGAEIAFCGDEIRSLKKENYLVLECQAQGFKNWTPYPNQVRIHAYSHLASGAGGQLYWNWHSIHNGCETYWKGILSHDLSKNPVYEEICCIGKEWNEYRDDLMSLKKRNRVALIVDNHSLTAFSWFPIDKQLTYNDVVRWMYDSLYEMNVECDIVHAKELIPSEYSVIITPALYAVEETILRKLKGFVREGGILISSFKSFVANEYLSVWPDQQPHLLSDCFGMTYNQFTEPGKAALHGREIRYLAELLQCNTAHSLGNYEHPYWGQYAAITENMYGKGYAYYVGCYTEKEELKEIYRRALEHAGITVNLEICFPVIIRSGVNQSGRTLHYLLHYSEEESVISCPYKRVRNVLSGKEFRMGDQITIPKWDVMILEEEEDA